MDDFFNAYSEYLIFSLRKVSPQTGQLQISTNNILYPLPRFISSEIPFNRHIFKQFLLRTLIHGQIRPICWKLSLYICKLHAILLRTCWIHFCAWIVGRRWTSCTVQITCLLDLFYKHLSHNGIIRVEISVFTSLLNCAGAANKLHIVSRPTSWSRQKN